MGKSITPRYHYASDRPSSSSLRLATHLFAESLLDRDHYFDWLLNTINQIDLETLPLYLLIIRSHLKEFGQSRRYGRRLAESLLEQLHMVCLSVSMRCTDV